VHCWLVFPLRDVPEVLAVRAHEEVGFTRKQNGVYVPHTRAMAFGALCSGGHEAHLEETLVIPSRTVLGGFRRGRAAEAYTQSGLQACQKWARSGSMRYDSLMVDAL